MPLDGFFLRFLTDELNRALSGSRVEKVYHPSKDELLLQLRSKSGAHRLMISASANCPRIHITENIPENPPQPSMFCMLMRKHLNTAVVSSIVQSELDRVVFINFDASSEIGDKVKLRLCVEIMARHSNIILINEDGQIIDSIKRIDMTKSSYRQVFPALPYVPPPAQDKMSICAVSADELMRRVLSTPEKSLFLSLLSSLQGASPLICREISANVCGGEVRTGDLTAEQSAGLKTELEMLREMLTSGGGQPFLLADKSKKPIDFSFMRINQYGFSVISQRMESFSRLLDSFYYERDRLDRTKQRAGDMFKVLSNASSRISRKLNVQQKELKDCEGKETLRINAELINANLGTLEKGAPFYEVLNYYDGMSALRISVDPALTPAANAQKYYKEYKKLKTAQRILADLIKDGEQELQYLETVSDLLARADTHADLDAIRAELEGAGCLKRRRKNDSKRQKSLLPMEYVSSDGFRIFVGRNNIQNDTLSLKTAKGGDIWLHTENIPGSHVIVESQGREVPPGTIEQAAMIAAYHSKARESSRVPVNYTFAKNLKKPGGARPGKVIFHTYGTLFVTPDKDKQSSLAVKR
ncbi:MAG: fibronectin/fibrinogen-binding protein [Clostridiales bacterium]|nr:fibronectin/fibrinogen-binding protein [Clostridiales bacterium]